MPRSDEVIEPGQDASRKPGQRFDPITLSTAIFSGTGLSSAAGWPASSTARSPSDQPALSARLGEQAAERARGRCSEARASHRALPRAASSAARAIRVAEAAAHSCSDRAASDDERGGAAAGRRPARPRGARPRRRGTRAASAATTTGDRRAGAGDLKRMSSRPPPCSSTRHAQPDARPGARRGPRGPSASYSPPRRAIAPALAQVLLDLASAAPRGRPVLAPGRHRARHGRDRRRRAPPAPRASDPAAGARRARQRLQRCRAWPPARSCSRAGADVARLDHRCASALPARRRPAGPPRPARAAGTAASSGVHSSPPSDRPSRAAEQQVATPASAAAPSRHAVGRLVDRLEEAVPQVP